MMAVQEKGAVVGGRGEIGTGWAEPLEGQIVDGCILR
jgi:hypothetical protein